MPDPRSGHCIDPLNGQARHQGGGRKYDLLESILGIQLLERSEGMRSFDSELSNLRAIQPAHVCPASEGDS
jgi:hypothetical protein